MLDNFFFSGTILENLLLAGSHVNEEKVRIAADIMGIDKLISTLPQTYNTRLGVGGVRLSSGQIQKLALVRALLKKPRLLLLDEVTSAMDVKSERRVLDGFRQLCIPECITVITTHRLAITLEPWVGRILILENGALIEQGCPLELYSQGGEYTKLMDLSGLGNLLKERKI